LNPFGTEQPADISAISCTHLNPARPTSSYIAVSSWKTNEVIILRTDGSSGLGYLQVVAKTEPHTSLPRSLLLCNFGLDVTSKKKVEADYRPHLLVGMTDGTLVSYAFNKEADIIIGKLNYITLIDKKTTSLGTTPVSLTSVERTDSNLPGNVSGTMRPTVCASGSRSTFLFWSQGRLQQSPILVNVSMVAIFLCSYSPDPDP
jgi:DNA damage-binding protein 1